jgi:ribosomal protein S18 acetylase RimI-like enzyme
MTQAEFDESLARGISRYAEERAQQGFWTEAEATEASRAEFAELLPRGRETRDRYFAKAVEEPSGVVVGETWYQATRQGGKPQFWVTWIWVEPEHRRRGHAREMLRLLEEEAARRGGDRLGLFVSADNRPALALYGQVGFVPTHLRMAKPLPRP